MAEIELFSDDPDSSPLWDEKYRMLSKLVALAVSVAPGEAIEWPLPPLEVAKQQRRDAMRRTEIEAE